MQNKNNNNKFIKNKLNKISKRINRMTRKKGVRRRRRLRRPQRRIPAAYPKGFRKQFQILSQGGNFMSVKGRDLIYKIPEDLKQNNNCNILTVIPCNPAYWLGTRISAIASGYQNYRPIKFNVHYVPQCAVTQQGNVIGGTLWAMAPNAENMQQTLRTSNGGILTQCYKSAVSKIGLKRNLQYNLFRMGGKFDQESNPFIYIAMTVGTINLNNDQILPGYFFVEYQFELRNPIGDTVKYFNSGLIQKQQFSGNYVNISAVNCSEPKINIGSILQLDNSNYTWNEQTYIINNDSYLWYFCNQVIMDENAEPEPDKILNITYNTTSSNTTQTTTSNTKNQYVIIDETVMLYEVLNQSQSSVITDLTSYMLDADTIYVIGNDDVLTNFEHFSKISANTYSGITKNIYVLDSDYTVNMVAS